MPRKERRMMFRSVTSVIVLLLVMFSTVSIALADALYWSAKAPMPTPRSRGASGVVDGKIYVLGGESASVLATVEVYDPATNSWSATSDMVHPRFAAGSAVHGPTGTIYIVGGSSGAGATNTVIKYNTADGTSSVVGNINTARFRTSCAIVGDNLYVFGGSTTGPGASVAISSGEVYSLTSNTVIDTFTLPQPLTLASAVRVGTKIYMIGGLTTGLVPVNNCWDFDPATKSFTPKAAMPTARGGIKGVAFSSGKIYVTGGVTSTGLPPTSYTSYVQEYDPSGNTWSLKGSMATPRYAPMGGVVNDVLYVIGGDNGSTLAVNESAYLQGGTTDTQDSFSGISSVTLSGAKLTFPSAASGLMAVSIGSTGPAAAPSGVSFRGQYYDIATSAPFSGNLTVTIPYDEGSIVGPAANLTLYHWNGSSWENLSTSVDTNAKTISASTSSLSPFVVGELSGGGGSASGFGMNTNILLALAAILMLSGIGLIRARRAS